MYHNVNKKHCIHFVHPFNLTSILPTTPRPHSYTMSSRQLSYYESVSARPSTQSYTSSAIFPHDCHHAFPPKRQLTHYNQSVSARPSTLLHKRCCCCYCYCTGAIFTRLHGGITVTYIITHTWSLTSTPHTPINLKNEFTYTGAIFTRLHGGITVTYIITTPFPTRVEPRLHAPIHQSS